MPTHANSVGFGNISEGLMSRSLCTPYWLDVQQASRNSAISVSRFYCPVGGLANPRNRPISLPRSNPGCYGGVGWLVGFDGSGWLVGLLGGGFLVSTTMFFFPFGGLRSRRKLVSTNVVFKTKSGRFFLAEWVQKVSPCLFFLPPCRCIIFKEYKPPRGDGVQKKEG